MTPAITWKLVFHIIGHLLRLHPYAPVLVDQKIELRVKVLAINADDVDLYIQGIQANIAVPLHLHKTTIKLCSECDRIKNRKRRRAVPLHSWPSCFGSKPGAQAQAENDCENCEVNKDCLK